MSERMSPANQPRPEHLCESNFVLRLFMPQAVPRPVPNSSTVPGSGIVVRGTDAVTVKTAKSPAFRLVPEEGMMVAEIIGLPMSVAVTPLFSKKVVWFNVAVKVAEENAVVSANCKLNKGLPLTNSGPGPKFPSGTLIGLAEVGRREKAALLNDNALATGIPPVKLVTLKAFVPGTGGLAGRKLSKEIWPIAMVIVLA